MASEFEKTHDVSRPNRTAARNPHPASEGSRVYGGHGVSVGVASGVAVKLEKRRLPVFRLRIARSRVGAELEKLNLGIERSREQILEIRKRLGEQVGEEHAYILEAQLLMLEDRVMLAEISDVIRNELVNVEWAIRTVTDKYLQAYRSLTEEYYRERGCDLADIRTRIITNITGGGGMDFTLLPNKMVLFVEQLDPSTVAAVDYRKIEAFVAEVGGWTSHAAILARSLQIPAVVGIRNVVQEVSSGEKVIVDGDEGEIIVSPSPDTLRAYRSRIKTFRRERVHTPVARQRDLYTVDGQRVILQATVELPHEVEQARNLGADGIGLFRSEYLLLNSQTALPEEDQQFQAFKQLAQENFGQTTTIRILDIGADKFTDYTDLPSELNPALGLRGIRFCLYNKDFFRAHLRAILRASAYGRLRLVLPFVGQIAELRQTKQLIEEIRYDLGSASIPFSPVPVGVMVELPSAVWIAEALAAECDFICLGTNDLVQYTLAVDRTNERIAPHFQPFHPAVIRSIKVVVDAASQKQLPLTLCGEAPSDPLFAYLAIGLGINNLSVDVNAVSDLAPVIGEFSFAEAQMAAKEILRFHDVTQIFAYLERRMGNASNDTRRGWYRRYIESDARKRIANETNGLS